MPRAEARAAAGQRRIRCAVYTRKSSEEGLEQAFNSLQAQREACEAFISSQRHEGWSCLPDLFDDGGLSGGTMERPALQLLLAAIRGGHVDAVVVHKVDRLTMRLSVRTRTRRSAKLASVRHSSGKGAETIKTNEVNG